MTSRCLNETADEYAYVVVMLNPRQRVIRCRHNLQWIFQRRTSAVQLAIESLLEGQAEALPHTAITKALEGDSVALRLCMDRIG